MHLQFNYYIEKLKEKGEHNQAERRATATLYIFSINNNQAEEMKAKADAHFSIINVDMEFLRM